LGNIINGGIDIYILIYLNKAGVYRYF